MARPKHNDIRDRQLNLKLTAAEFERLRRRAAASGMRLVDFGRARLLAEWRVTETAVAATPHLDPLFQAQLSRLGNNLNQIARRMHAFQEPAPPALAPLLDELRTLINRGASA